MSTVTTPADIFTACTCGVPGCSGTSASWPEPVLVIPTQRVVSAVNERMAV